MNISLFITAIMAAAVSAQTTTTSAAAAATTCAAQNILDACLATTTGYVSLCHSDDYICLCDKYIAIMTCFDNCPGDARAATYESEKDLYCMNASIYGFTTGSPPTSTSSAASATDSASATGGSDDDNKASSTHKGSSATRASSPLETGRAAKVAAVPGGGAVVALAGWMLAGVW